MIQFTTEEQLALVSEALNDLTRVMSSMPFSTRELLQLDGNVEKAKWAIACDIAEAIAGGEQWSAEEFTPSWHGIEDEYDENDDEELTDEEEEAREEIFRDILLKEIKDELSDDEK